MHDILVTHEMQGVVLHASPFVQASDVLAVQLWNGRGGVGGPISYFIQRQGTFAIIVVYGKMQGIEVVFTVLTGGTMPYPWVIFEMWSDFVSSVPIV